MADLKYNDFKRMSAQFRSAGRIREEYGCLQNMYKLDRKRTYNELLAFRDRLIGMLSKNKGNADIRELVKSTYQITAPDYFDDFCIFLEFDRPREKRFYLPRRKQLLPIVNALQRLADDDLDLLSISLPPGTGKSATAIFYLCWLAGRNPDEPILGSSHSMSFLDGVYNECLRIIKSEEYNWSSAFPGVQLNRTNAKDLRIDLGKAKRFETLEFTSVGAGNAGKVRAVQLLYCDDLVDGIETAMSKDRLDKLWQLYTTDLRQRKQGNHCKELHIATRWSLYDPIGRLQEAYAGSDRALFIAIPALNENDESNFDYPFGVGFTTEFYHEQRKNMDDASWRALYMNEPIERGGVLYDWSELRTFFELPDREPDAIISVCDIADGGGDYWVLPVGYKYGDLVYIDKFVCDNGKPDLVETKIVNTLVERKVEMARFESNRAGGRVAESVQKRVKEKGGRCRVTTKWNQANKETRIIMASGYVKEHFLFRDKSTIEDDKEYRTAMLMLTGYSMSRKNKNDDVPDAMAMLSDMVQGVDGAKVSVRTRLW